MTKQSIVSILKSISDSYQTSNDNISSIFHINDTSKCFSVRIVVGIKYCGSIYCDCIMIDNDLIRFIDDGKIIAIFDYLSIEAIDIL